MRHFAIALFALAALTGGLMGCASLVKPAPPISANPPRVVQLSSRKTDEASFRSAAEPEANGDESCVDSLYVSCRRAWEQMLASPAGDAHTSRVLQRYNEQVAALLQSAQQFGRFDLARGLLIRSETGWLTVPVVARGFAQQASEFHRFRWPPLDREPLLTRRYGRAGAGVPLVLERRRNDADPSEVRFLPESSYFAATAVLTFADDDAVLELVNPLVENKIDLGTGPQPLAADLSAPLAVTLEEAPRTYLAGFVEPGGATSAAALTCVRPHQSGKVPLVLVHGLFSDPLSWADLINDLQAAPGFDQRFQVWVFRYPTGQGFLQSAAVLRRELAAAIDAFDSQRGDPALRQVVLIGHSMGGLVSKLQVTYSEELVWSRLADRPLHEIVTTEETRAVLAETCFFDPSPDVARVIFIASPHHGSLLSSGLIGQAAALLVEPSPAQASMHEQLIRDNPGTFNPLFERRFPTSIDMLSPKSPLLEAMHKMRIRSGVKLHNIIGVTHPVSLDGPSDGVVSVRSASHPDCRSVCPVSAPHAKAHRALETSAEILRILGCSNGQAGEVSTKELPDVPSEQAYPTRQETVRH
ncbi:MAG TPA: alpha/beta fold hydrolase [Pirellulaceae bacterium]|nr:alpha/beta fold hydrolase [Pirellulaceae bacterium]